MLYSHQEAIVTAVQSAMPAVVSVVVSHELERHKQQTQSPSPLRIPDGGGSGFLVEPHGTVLTNRHVLHDPNADYTIILHSGEEFPAMVLARDPINDVGILQIDHTDHPTVTLGDSRNLSLGQTAIAIGNALGQFRNTVSVGVVSGLSRAVNAGFDDPAETETQNLRGLIQTDAAINPGNSGGPLIDIHGAVIGINAAVIMSAQNISFAIPVHNALRDLDHLREHGRLLIPHIGVRYITLTPERQRLMDAPIDHGALVVTEEGDEQRAVHPGGPADNAGIHEGDIITSCAGETITAERTILDIIQDHEPGETITCEVLRSGEAKKDVEVTLEERA